MLHFKQILRLGCIKRCWLWQVHSSMWTLNFFLQFQFIYLQQNTFVIFFVFEYFNAINTFFLISFGPLQHMTFSPCIIRCFNHYDICHTCMHSKFAHGLSYIFNFNSWNKLKFFLMLYLAVFIRGKFLNIEQQNLLIYSIWKFLLIWISYWTSKALYIGF